MRESISDDKNACRKVKRILSSQTDLDAEIHYVPIPTMISDEVMEHTIEDIDLTSTHYSKRNVDRRTKRVKT